MKKNNLLSNEDIELFRSSINGTRQFKQDAVFHPPQRCPIIKQEKRHLSAKIDNSFYFSDNFQPYLDNDGPTRYLRADIDHFELKKLRRGDYTPKFFLDLHGVTQHQAKQELGALIAACQQHQISCACVMHGYGKHILKQRIPLWLAQHPLIRAFHQASHQWGGGAALLILIETDPNPREQQR